MKILKTRCKALKGLFLELLTKKEIEKEKVFKMVIKRMLQKLENRVSVGAVAFTR